MRKQIGIGCDAYYIDTWCCCQLKNKLMADMHVLKKINSVYLLK